MVSRGISHEIPMGLRRGGAAADQPTSRPAAADQPPNCILGSFQKLRPTASWGFSRNFAQLHLGQDIMYYSDYSKTDCRFLVTKTPRRERTHLTRAFFGDQKPRRERTHLTKAWFCYFLLIFIILTIKCIKNVYFYYFLPQHVFKIIISI